MLFFFLFVSFEVRMFWHICVFYCCSEYQINLRFFLNVSFSLSDLTGSLLPVTIFDKHSLRVLFHFARDSPPARPDVLVVIISMLSSAPLPITNVRFQAAVPKVTIYPCIFSKSLLNFVLKLDSIYVQTMRVKLQPPSGSDLPAFNPILPPAAITQVLLLANPHKVNKQIQIILCNSWAAKVHIYWMQK